MRIIAWVCMICFISIPGSALAFNNQVTAGIEKWDWSEDYDYDDGSSGGGDYDQKRIFASYTYFLSPVEDNGEPLDLLPFFYSRSSYVYGDIYTGDWDFDEDDTDYSSEKDWTGYGLGGVFYLTPTTGIGAGLFTQDGDWEDNDAVADDSYDEGRDGWHVLVRHYLDDSSRLSVRLSQTDRERDFDNGFERSDEYRWLIFSYDAVVSKAPNLFLGVEIGDGSRKKDDSNDNELDHDLIKIGVTVGPVYRNFAIYFSYDYYEWDPKGYGWEADETYYTISPRYWFSEQLMLGGNLSYYSWDESRNDYDYEENGREIEVTVGYRF